MTNREVLEQSPAPCSSSPQQHAALTSVVGEVPGSGGQRGVGHLWRGRGGSTGALCDKTNTVSALGGGQGPGKAGAPAG